MLQKKKSLKFDRRHIQSSNRKRKKKKLLYIQLHTNEQINLYEWKEGGEGNNYSQLGLDAKEAKERKKCSVSFLESRRTKLLEAKMAPPSNEGTGLKHGSLFHAQNPGLRRSGYILRANKRIPPALFSTR